MNLYFLQRWWSTMAVAAALGDERRSIPTERTVLYLVLLLFFSLLG